MFVKFNLWGAEVDIRRLTSVIMLATAFKYSTLIFFMDFMV